MEPNYGLQLKIRTTIVLLKLKMLSSQGYENDSQKPVLQMKCLESSQNIMPFSYDLKFVAPFKNTKLNSSKMSNLILPHYMIALNFNTGTQKLMQWLNLEIYLPFQGLLYGLDKLSDN